MAVQQQYGKNNIALNQGWGHFEVVMDDAMF